MNLWKTYCNKILKNYDDFGAVENGLPYWRDYLFILTVIYILPLSLIALIPGLIVSFHFGFYTIAFFDSFAAISLILIAFSKSISQLTKKILFFIVVYGLAFVLLSTLGSFGPGLVYLLAGSIFMIIIFPSKYSWLSVIINIIFCTFYGLFIEYNLVSIHQSDINNTISWFAITSNLIFLNAVFSILIPKLFDGMQISLDKQRELDNKLQIKQKDLENSLSLVKSKNQELEQFAYIASHDLQEPLRMITSYLALLNKKYNSLFDEKAKQYIFFASDGAQRMRNIISDLLEYSRISRTEYIPEKLKLEEVVKEVISLQKRLISETEAEIKYYNLPEIYVYKTPLIQILQNLINNAIKYRKEETKPVIYINANENEEEWLISVKDNGIGIDKNSFNKIFVIFHRLHSRDKFDGTGIGLAITKKIVENLGGKIWVESEEGKGSTFYFTLKKQ